MTVNRSLLLFTDVNKNRALETEGALWVESYESRKIRVPTPKGLEDDDMASKCLKEYELVLSDEKSFTAIHKRLPHILGESHTVNLCFLTILDSSKILSPDVCDFIQFFPTLRVMKVYCQKTLLIKEILDKSNIEMVHILQPRARKIAQINPQPLVVLPLENRQVEQVNKATLCLAWFSTVFLSVIFFISAYYLNLAIKGSCSTGRASRRCQYIINESTIRPSLVMTGTLLAGLCLVLHLARNRQLYQI